MQDKSWNLAGTDVVGCPAIFDHHLSHEKNPGWLGYIGDYTTRTQVFRDYNKPL